MDHADPAFLVPSIATTPTHKLILNKFCLFRPQYLLLTRDATRRQGEALDAADLLAAWRVLGAVRPEGYVVYNGGRGAGGSRRHKHLQVLSLPGVDGEEGGGRGLWPKDMGAMPYLWYEHRFEWEGRGEEEVVDGLVAAVGEHGRLCREVLGVGEDGDEGRFEHNVILTRGRLVTIPRRRGTVEGIKGHNVGAQGMLGLVWVGNEEQMEGWKAIGPVQVLAELGVVGK